MLAVGAAAFALAPLPAPLPAPLAGAAAAFAPGAFDAGALGAAAFAPGALGLLVAESTFRLPRRPAQTNQHHLRGGVVAA